MTTYRRLRVTVLVVCTLLSLGLNGAASAAVSCSREVQAVWTNTNGRLVLNSAPIMSSTPVRIWGLCDLELVTAAGVIAPGVCQVFYGNLLVGLTTGLPVTITFDDAVLSSMGLWDPVAATCDSITNWGNVEPALKSIQVGN